MPCREALCLLEGEEGLLPTTCPHGQTRQAWHSGPGLSLSLPPSLSLSLSSLSISPHTSPTPQVMVMMSPCTHSTFWEFSCFYTASPTTHLHTWREAGMGTMWMDWVGGWWWVCLPLHACHHVWCGVVTVWCDGVCRQIMYTYLQNRKILSPGLPAMACLCLLSSMSMAAWHGTPPPPACPPALPSACASHGSMYSPTIHTLTRSRFCRHALYPTSPQHIFSQARRKEKWGWWE